MKEFFFKKKYSKQEQILTGFLLFILLVTAVLFIYSLSIKQYIQGDMETGESYREYKYHYMMIGSGTKDSFWNELCRGAEEEGGEKGILVENFSDIIEEDMSVKNKIELAVAADVDGIIVKGDLSAETAEAIDRASENNVPVITVWEDAPKSKRKAFIGVNSHQLGEVYGNQIRNLKREEPLKAVVLMNEGALSSPDILLSSLKHTVSGEEISVEAIRMEADDEFNAEETIRSLVLKPDRIPDVLICLSGMDTLCAYHAVLDYNAVGKMQIIGYSQEEDILDAIRKEVVAASVTIDTKNMGAKAVDTLYTFQKEKRVNEYETVDAHVISKENIAQFAKEAGENERE